MPSRREIREITVQFLYCADLESGAIAPDFREPFWSFITESDQRKLLAATYRAVKHLALGRDPRLSDFVTRAETLKPHLAAEPKASDISTTLKRLLALESSWSMTLAELDRVPKEGDDGEIAESFTIGLEKFFKIDRDLEFNRSQFLTAALDLPSLKGQLEAIIASIKKLQRISDRIRAVESPENFPEISDLTKIRQSKAEITALKQQTDTLADAVIACKPEIDQCLSELVENYDPSRIDPIDRAILRLGSYELLKTDVPAKIVINEAIELAKRYGTTDSKRFVNGLLDAVAKTTEQA